MESHRAQLRKLAKAMKAESQALIEKDDLPGSPMETQAIETWKTQNPKLYSAMKDYGALEAMAHVVVNRMLDQETALVKAGWNPADARTEAYRDQMMLGE